MSDDTNDRERVKREARLRELGLRPTYDGFCCFHCQIPLPMGSCLLCAACEGD